ncbi:MAG: FeoA family protein [Sarcina sp.]
METLASKNINEEFTVKLINGHGKLRKKLLDMGITPKTKVKIVGKAPMGDPIEILIRGYKLTLRKDEAEMIVVD